MFCQNCGAQNADGSKFCISCGTAFGATAAPAAEVTEVAAVETVAAPVVTEPQKAVSKRQYFSKVAPKGQRIKRYIALALGVLCILTVCLATNKTVNGSLFEIPVMSLVTSVVDDATDAQAEFDEAVDELRDKEYDEIADILGDLLDESITARQIKKNADEIIDLCSPLSLSSLVELGEMFGMEDSEMVMGLSTAITLLWAIAAVLMVLTGLGVLFQKTWLMVLSYIFAMGFVAFTGGLVYFVIATVLYIATAVLFSKLKYDYKVYKASCKA